MKNTLLLIIDTLFMIIGYVWKGLLQLIGLGLFVLLPLIIISNNTLLFATYIFVVCFVLGAWEDIFS